MQEQLMREALASWLRRVFSQTQTLTFSSSLVALNVVQGNVTIGGVTTAISVPFTLTNEATLNAVARAIGLVSGVSYAWANGRNQIQVIADPGISITLSSWVVTGGLTQPAIAVASILEPVPVIYDFQALPASGPFVAFRIGSIISKSYDTKLGFNSSGVMVSGGLRIATITVSYFGYNPENGTPNYYGPQNASLISDSLEKTSVQTAFNAQGFAYLHKNPVQQLTYLLESKYQPRADFDFYLGFVSTSVDDIGWIERARITGQIRAGSITENIQRIVPEVP